MRWSNAPGVDETGVAVGVGVLVGVGVGGTYVPYGPGWSVACPEVLSP